MTTGKAIGAQVVSSEYCALFIMRENLELGASVQRMFFGLADDAVVRGTCISGERRNLVRGLLSCGTRSFRGLCS